MIKYAYSSIALIVIVLMIIPATTLASIINLSALAKSNYFNNQNVFLYQGPLIKGDYYAFGNCTYWVFYLRQKINEPIPTNWGNAISWASNAKKDGYVVNNTPSFGAIMQDPNAYGGLGHVAFVLRVNSNSFTISEMNRVGFDEVDTRTIPLSELAKYNFIHNKSS